MTPRSSSQISICYLSQAIFKLSKPRDRLILKLQYISIRVIRCDVNVYFKQK